jgi:hypothetical protein
VKMEADTAVMGPQARPSCASCVTHSIGPDRHIGIWSSSTELRGMVSFPKGVTWGLSMGPHLELGSLQVKSPCPGAVQGAALSHVDPTLLPTGGTGECLLFSAPGL